jgi:hypothetical protein
MNSKRDFFFFCKIEIYMKEQICFDMSYSFCWLIIPYFNVILFENYVTDIKIYITVHRAD